MLRAVAGQAGMYNQSFPRSAGVPAIRAPGVWRKTQVCINLAFKRLYNRLIARACPSGWWLVPPARNGEKMHVNVPAPQVRVGLHPA